MNSQNIVRQSSLRRAHRTRTSIHGTAQRPRLSVHVSHQHVVAQIINDDTGKTLAYATTAGQKASTGSLGEKAAAVGEDIGKKAKSAKVKTVVLDRGSKLYHGRVAALADAARKAGLEF